MRFAHRWLAFSMAVLAVLAPTCPIGRAQEVGLAAAPLPLAITSVDVLPMTAGEPILRDQTVVIENGRIAAIGPARSLRVPHAAVRISGRGRYLMPGLADMHVHLEYFDDPAYLQLFLLNGITFVRSMDGRPIMLDWRRRVQAGTLAGPEIHTAGPILDGNPPARSDNLALAAPEDARRTVEQQADAGYDFIKLYTNLAPEVFRAAIQSAKARNMRVAGHRPRAVPLGDFLLSGVNSVEHLGDFADAIIAPDSEADGAPEVLRRRLGFRVDGRRMDALASTIVASRVWVVPTMIQSDRAIAPAATVQAWATAPEIATVRGMLGYWRASTGRAASLLGESNWGWVEQARANRLALVGAFHRAGVPMLIGTDTPNPFVFPGASVHDELANFVAAGMTPANALAAATREPARFLGQDRFWGTIEVGKRADLLLLDANPLVDIGATRRIAGVIARGRWMPAGRLRQMRLEVERIDAAGE